MNYLVDNDCVRVTLSLEKLQKSLFHCHEILMLPLHIVGRTLLSVFAMFQRRTVGNCSGRTVQVGCHSCCILSQQCQHTAELCIAMILCDTDYRASVNAEGDS